MTDRFININGRVVSEAKSGLSVQNRAYKFGDSVFETIRVINGRPLFLEDHFSRMSRAIKILKYDTPSDWSISFCKKEIEKLLEQNGISRGGKVRFTLFRNSGGLYIPKNNDMGYSIEATVGESNNFQLSNDGILLGIYNEIRLNASIISPFKTNNCLPYIMAGLSLKDSKFNDVLLLNMQSSIVEAISSNVFILIDGILYTPPVKDGCVAGVMRKKIIQICKKINVPVVETSVNEEIISRAEEIFLTNAISGIKWVKAFEKTRFFHKLSERLVNELNRISN